MKNQPKSSGPIYVYQYAVHKLFKPAIMIYKPYTSSNQIHYEQLFLNMGFILILFMMFIIWFFVLNQALHLQDNDLCFQQNWHN